MLRVLWLSLKCLFTALRASTPTAEQILLILDLLEQAQLLFNENKEVIRDLLLEMQQISLGLKKSLAASIDDMRSTLKKACPIKPFACCASNIDFGPTFFSCCNPDTTDSGICARPLPEVPLQLRSTCPCVVCSDFRVLTHRTQQLVCALELFAYSISKLDQVEETLEGAREEGLEGAGIDRASTQ
ncbi:agnoprotein [Myotis horsfieldii polyomavirus 1]|nr:agnoprotein [Myotis horsfieldii polyomavirus 1]